MNITDVIEKKFAAVNIARRTIIPKIIANEVLNMALNNFKKQGFQGDTFQPWKKRKPVARKTSTRAILIKTGRGRRSIHVTRADVATVSVGSPEPYMKAHNEGSTELVTVKKHTRKKYGVTKVGTGIYSVKSKKEKMKSESYLSGHSKVKSHQRRMRLPKRQILGKSQFMIDRLKRVYGTEVLKAFNK